MAYIVNSGGCCHCPTCWNLADVPHGTFRNVFTVRETHDDGFVYHVLPEGFISYAAAVAAFEKHVGKVKEQST